MPLNTRETGKVRTFTIRPFGGRNSDTDAMSIANNEASGGSNFRVERGVLQRRPSFNRVAIPLTLGVGTQINFVHAFLPDSRVVGSGTTTPIISVIRLATRGGVIQMMSPLRTPTNMYPYDEGTVSLSTGSRTMAGTGTAWISRGIHAGASIMQGTQVLSVRSVNSETSIELESLPTSGGSALAYDVGRYGVNWYGAVTSEYVTPDYAEFLCARGTTIAAGGQIIRNRAMGSFAAATQVGTLIPGNRWFGVGQNLYDYFSQTVRQGAWFYFAGDNANGNELHGNPTPVRRRGYKYMGRNTVDGSRRLYFHERFRGTAGAGSEGVYFNQGWAALLEGDAISGSYHVEIQVTGPGTVSINQGATTVNGTGTGFLQSNLQSGDEIQVTNRRYRVISVSDNQTLTIQPPFDQTTVPAGSAYTMFFRRIAINNSTAMNVSFQTGTVSTPVRSTNTGTVYFRPRLLRSGTTPVRRMQVTSGIISSPEVNNTREGEAVFVCSCLLESDYRRHNIWMNYAVDLGAYWGNSLSREIIPVSMVAPQAKQIEFWNGRLFAADLLEYVDGTTTLAERPLRLRWTRPNEPYSWWSEFATDGSSYADITNGKGEIKAIKVHANTGSLVVYREHGFTTFSATGDSVNPFYQRYLDIGPAPVDRHAIIAWNRMELYLGTDGALYAFDGERVQRFPCPLETFIKDNLRFDFSQWTMGLHNVRTSELCWFIPTTANSRNLTYGIVYNYKVNAWYLWDLTSNPLQSVAYVHQLDESLENRLVGVDTNNNIVMFRDDPGIDFAASIGGGTRYTTEWISKEFVLPVPDQDSEPREKNVTAVGLVYDPASSGRISIDVSRNGGANWINFANTTLVAGSSGTSQVFGNGMAVGNTHMVRLRQTPLDTTSNSGMAIRAVRLYYEDYGEPAR